MVTALDRALELAKVVAQFPVERCSPSDDPDKETAYVFGFLQEARPFVAAIGVTSENGI